MYCFSHTATLHLIIQSFSNKITQSKFSHLITEAFFYKFWSANFIYGSYVSQHMSQIEGVINQNLKTSISQKFPNRSFHVILQNDHIFILHIAAHPFFMAFFFNPKLSSGAVCIILEIIDEQELFSIQVQLQSTITNMFMTCVTWHGLEIDIIH